MFWKTPWWAEVPCRVKLYIEKVEPPAGKIIVDYFQPPPRRDCGEIPITDRRGVLFEFFDVTYIVTGFAESAIKWSPNRTAKPPGWVGSWDRNRTKKVKKKAHKWWTMNADGSFRVFRWTAISKMLRRNHEPC